MIEPKWICPHRFCLIAFSLCFLYWSYLFFATRMDISMDAISYEETARLIYEKGWGEFFRLGPQREPLYPFLVSQSMFLGNVFQIPYTVFQKIFQIGILLVTQILAWRILHKMNVTPIVQLFTLIYIGISPTIVNSALSLFNEIASYPFVLGIVLCHAGLWSAIRKGSMRQVVAMSICGALVFLGAAFSRGVFQYIFYIFLIPYLILLICAIKEREKNVIKTVMAFFLVSLVGFQSVVFAYKSLNKYYNGNFVFTNRFDSMFYANTEKRSRKLDQKVFLSHLASVPGIGFCRLFFTEQECTYASFQEADDIMGRYNNDVVLASMKKGIPRDQVRVQTMKDAKENIVKRPFQYALFMLMEGSKMFFWESTKIGFVFYPAWMRSLYDAVLFKNGLRLLTGVLSMAGFFYLCFYNIRHGKTLLRLKEEGPADRGTVLCFFMGLMIVSYSVLYSLFTVLTRYTFPICILFILSTAFLFERLLVKNNRI